MVKYYERSNIIAGYVNKGAIAPMLFNGSCNTRLFEGWVEQCLVKELKKQGKWLLWIMLHFMVLKKLRI